MAAREPVWRRYLRFLGPDVGADVDDELRFHLEMREAEYRARGLRPDAARDAARARFGDVDGVRRALRRRDGRRQRRRDRAELLEEFGQDIRYGVRMLWRHRGFSAAAALTLALGIGATTAMFSAVDAAMLRPLPFADPGALVTLAGVNVPFAPDGAAAEPSPVPDLRSVRQMPDLFAGAAAFADGGLNLSGADGEAARVRVGVVTVDLFDLLGVRPARGRGFTPEEGRPNGPLAVVLSDGLWRRRFGGEPALGRSVSLNGRTYTVVGVMPRGFGFPRDADLWIPLTVPMTFASFDAFRGYVASTTVARLAPGASAAAARARLDDLWARAPEEYHQWRPDGLGVTPLQAELVGERQKPLLVLLGATTLLLFIACANVTNLLLVRAAARRREIAVRAVLGATRRRLVRQLLTESLLLSLAGALGGLVLAFACLGVARALMPATLTALAAPTVDLRVLVFAVALAMLTGLGFGLWPALGGARTDAHETIKGGGLGTTAGAAGRVRRALVTFELAVALTLLAGAGLMLRSLHALVTTDAGFQPDRVATLELTFGRQRSAADRLRLTTAVLDRLEGVPGIEAAGVVNDLPLRGGGISISVQPEGGADVPFERRFARYLQATPGYFAALGIPLLRGRLMNAADDSAAPHVAVINATMARLYWPDQDPVGKRFGDGRNDWRTVIGVVGDIRELQLDQEPLPQMYFPAYENVPGNLALTARGTLPRDALLEALRAAVRGADPGQPVYNVRTMDAVRATSLATRRTNTGLIVGFGALALLLAAVGVYGVVAYGVAQRTRELGIRAALGATDRDLVRLVAREGAWVAGLGAALGVAGAWGFSRVLRSLLYGISPTDPLTFAAAPLVLVVIAMAATLVPARRAGRCDPAEVIRSD